MKKKMTVLLCVIAILLAGNVYQFWSNTYANRFHTDMVPDKETAIEIAKDVLFPICGESALSRETTVVLDKTKNAWVVRFLLPEGYLGGDYKVSIRKSDCKIVDIYLGM